MRIASRIIGDIPILDCSGRRILCQATIIGCPSSQVYGDSEMVLARWDDPQYSIHLFRFACQATFGLHLYSKLLDALAQPDILKSIRLKDQKKPQREIERRNEEEEEKRATGQKTRLENKDGFRPQDKFTQTSMQIHRTLFLCGGIRKDRRTKYLTGFVC
jgi:hypothetical protein